MTNDLLIGKGAADVDVEGVTTVLAPLRSRRASFIERVNKMLFSLCLPKYERRKGTRCE
jgi:hypothetical protein